MNNVMAAADDAIIPDRRSKALLIKVAPAPMKKDPINMEEHVGSDSDEDAVAGRDPTVKADPVQRFSQEVCSDILFLEAVIDNLEKDKEHSQYARTVVAQLQELVRRKLRSLNNADTCVEDLVEKLENRVNTLRRTIMDKYWDELQTLRHKQLRNVTDQHPTTSRQRRLQRYNEGANGLDSPHDSRLQSSESDEIHSVIDRFDRFISRKYKDELKEVRRTSMPRLHQRRTGPQNSPEQSLADQILRSRRTNRPDYNTPRSISQIKRRDSDVESVYSRAFPALTPRDQSYYRSDKTGGYGQSPTDSGSYHDEIMDIVAAVNNSKITDTDGGKGIQRKQSDRDMKPNGYPRNREQRVKRSEVPIAPKDGGFRHREQNAKRTEEPLYAGQTISSVRRSEEPVNGEQGHSPRRRSDESENHRDNGLHQRESPRKRSMERVNGRERRSNSPPPYNGSANDKPQGWQYHNGNGKTDTPRYGQHDDSRTRLVSTQSDMGTARGNVREKKKKKERSPSPRTNRTSWMRVGNAHQSSQAHACPNCDQQKKKEERQSKRKVDVAKKKETRPRQKVKSNDHRVTNVRSGDIPRPKVYGIATRQEREPEKTKRERQRIDAHYQREDSPPPEHTKYSYDEGKHRSGQRLEPSQDNIDKIFDYEIVKGYGRLAEYNNDYFGQFRH